MSQESRNSRWKMFRTSEDCIPSDLYEAAVFIQNARLHLLAYGYDSLDARLILNDAHVRVNECYAQQVAA
jgi:hypothetical protein